MTSYLPIPRRSYIYTKKNPRNQTSKMFKNLPLELQREIIRYVSLVFYKNERLTKIFPTRFTNHLL